MKKSAVLILFIILKLQGALCQQNISGAFYAPQNSIIHKVDSLNERAFHIKRFDLERSFAMLSEAARLAKQVDYQKGLATNLLYEAGIYQQNGMDKRALHSYHGVLEISRKIGDTFNIARANQQIGNALQSTGQTAEAEKVFVKAMAAYRQLKKTEELANTKNSLGSLRLQQKNLPGAALLFEEALDDSRRARYKYGEKKALYSLGQLNIAQGNLKKAATYFDSSRAINKETHDQYGLALDYLQFAHIARLRQQYAESIAQAKVAYEHARSINAAALVTEAIEKIVAGYQQQNNYLEITRWQNQLILHQRNIAKRDRVFTFNLIEMLRSRQDQQHDLEKISQREKLQLAINVIVCIALVFLSWLAYQWFKNYKRAESYSLELADKNLQIERSSASLDLLNKAISKQNVRLEESNRMKDKLLSIISHDLRHPLVNTKGILELVNLNLVNPEETKQLLSQLESQYVRSLTLLDNLLFWIRGQMKGEAIDKVRINLRQLMEDLIEDHRIPLQNKQITTCNSVEPGMSVLGDKEMLKIIFRNLLSNAIKFTPKEGEILVYSSGEFGPTIHIKDSGVGMNGETLLKVNAKQYFTTRGTGNEAGSGFGLMLCRDLIEKHNGTLTIKSEPGRGSTFSVQLPAPLGEVVQHQS